MSYHLNVNPPRETSLQAIEARTGRTIPRPKEISIPREVGEAIAKDFIARIREIDSSLHVSIAGSIRREKKSIHDIDILISPTSPTVARAIPTWGEPIINGSDKISILYQYECLERPEYIQADFRFIAPESWGPALQYFTGSADHNIRLRAWAKSKNLLLNEHGLFTKTGTRVDDNTEGGIYKALGLRWLPPKYREPKEYVPKPSWCLDHQVKDFCRRERMIKRKEKSP